MTDSSDERLSPSVPSPLAPRRTENANPVTPGAIRGRLEAIGKAHSAELDFELKAIQLRRDPPARPPP